jgi:hypothetical protein
MPAFCTACGAAFPVRLPLGLPPGMQVLFKGNATNCPYCGGYAEMADGVFVVGVAQNALRIISAPEITLDRLRQFGLLLERGYQAKTPVRDLARRAAEIDPRFENAVAAAEGTGRYTWTVLLLMLLAMTQCNMELKVNLDLNQIFNQLFGTSPQAALEAAASAANDAERSDQSEGAHRPDAARGSAQREHKPVPKRKPRH